MNIVVIGMGYPSTTNLWFALRGIPCAALLPDDQDSSFNIRYSLFANNGKSPFDGDEPGLAELIHRVAVEKDSFRVTDDYAACAEADVILFDVQTPTDAEQGRHVPHYESLREVSAEVGRRLQPGALVIIDSTVAPGTTQNVVQPILEREFGLRGGRAGAVAALWRRCSARRKRRDGHAGKPTHPFFCLIGGMLQCPALK